MNDSNEMVTKGMFRDAMDDIAKRFDKRFDSCAGMINRSFQGLEFRMANREDLLALTVRVNGLEREMRGMHDNMDAIFLEIKETRREIKEADTRADVVDLQIRVGKLEKKVR
jgi:hypothetical protein